MTSPAHPHHPASLRKLAAILTSVVVVVILLLAGLACYQWGRASAEAGASQQTDNLNGCRASFRSELIDGPIIDGLAAVGAGNTAAVAAAAKAAQRKTYDDLVLLSRKDPAEFLAQCRARYG